MKQAGLGKQPRLPHTTVEPYRGKSPRAFTFAKEWKQNTEIARAYLEKDSKWMKRWADKDRRPQQFQRILYWKAIIEYLVKWAGLGPEEVSWEKALDLQAFQKKIEENNS
ncbi:hypothetical protein COLO4_06923 [Corchorus olitorius]|uniref:Chromo domain-containing protein n=1 Tax=Corchorus olitorius TaxID=93759 RepID=A0A1R3KLI5_9ROSI|nr:hypothetical protein COLO4_06923 [Corchorus olitorius]